MGGLAKFKNNFSKHLHSLNVQKEIVKNVVTGNLYRSMNEEGKSKSDLAKLLKVSKPAVTHLLSGERNFTIDKLTEISHHLNRVPKIEFIKKSEMTSDVIITDLRYCEKTEEIGIEETVYPDYKEVKFYKSKTEKEIMIKFDQNCDKNN